jgi:hypothetical protein
MPAQGEEVVVGADPVAAEQLGPQRRHRLLEQPARRRRLSSLLLDLQRGESPPVHLAAGGEREGFHERDPGRHQGIRQALLEEAPQRVRRHLGARHREGGEAGVRAALLHHHRGRGDRGVGGERRLDLPRLDSDAADLHLEVQTAQVLQVSGRQPAHAVAGAVQALSREGGKRIRYEALGREVRPAQVAAGQEATETELPRHSRRHQVSPAVEDSRRPVRHRPPDRHRIGKRHGPEQGRRDDRLGGAVGVEQRDLGDVPQPAPRGLRRQGLSSDHHSPQGTGPLPNPPPLRGRGRPRPWRRLRVGSDAADAFLHPLLPVGGRQVQVGDP